MTFSTTITVRYSEVDGQGVVFNAHWMAYFDVAYCEYLEHLGNGPAALAAGTTTFDSMLVHAELDWRGSATYRDELTIEVVPSRLGTTSFDVTYTARLQGEVRVSGVLTYVSVDPQHRPQPLPRDVREAFTTAAPAA